MTADGSQTVCTIHYIMHVLQHVRPCMIICACTCALYMHILYMPELERDSEHLYGEFLIDNGSGINTSIKGVLE